MTEYSNYVMGEAEIETEKAYLAPIEGFAETAIWIPKSVVHPETKKIKKWFIEKKERGTKDYVKPRNQSSIDEFFK